MVTETGKEGEVRGRIEEILKGLQARLGDKVKEIKIDKKLIKISVEVEALVEAAKYLRDQGFDHVKGVTGVDLIALRPSEDAIELIYHASSYLHADLSRYVVNLATKIGRNTPEVPSLIEVWPSSEYHERETHEMLGVVFKGHPNLKKFLLPEWWSDIPPLRKDYKPPGRE